MQREVAARRADGRIVRNIPRQVQSLSPFGAAPFAQGSLWLAAPKDNSQPKRLLPPAGEEAGRRCLTDGRGNCKALGMVDFCRGISQAEMVYLPTYTPSVCPSGSQLPPEEGALGDKLRQPAPSYRRSLMACLPLHHPPPNHAPKPHEPGAPPQSRRLEEATKQAAWGREGPLPL